MVFGFLPMVMLFAFFAILPLEVLKGSKWDGYEPIIEGAEEDEEVRVAREEGDEAEGALLTSSIHSASGHTFSAVNSPVKKGFSQQAIAAWNGFRANLKKTKHLFFP